MPIDASQRQSRAGLVPQGKQATAQTSLQIEVPQEAFLSVLKIGE